MADGDLTARITSSVGSLPQAEWDALAGHGNPFVSHAFLTSLEDSGSVGPGTGWTPAPLVIEDARGTLLAAMPSYAKTHSQGEYVFDYAWADAWHRAGGEYYPKLQVAVPFTPPPDLACLSLMGRSRPRCCAPPRRCATATASPRPMRLSSSRARSRCSRTPAG